MKERIGLAGIEINAVMHCNLACAGCSHASPVAPEWTASPSQVKRDLDDLGTAADVREVRVVGGEPLLHPDLARLLAAIRASGAGADGTLRVITNGTRLGRVGWNWLDYVDEVYVSVYPRAAIDAEALRELIERGRQGGKHVGVNRYKHFRPALPVQRLTAEETAAVFETCQVAHAWSCHTVQDGYVYMCPMTVTTGPGVDGKPTSRCAIAPVQTLAARLRAFLGRRDPLPECSSCLGTVGRLTLHKQANRRTWRQLSVSTVDWAHVERIRADPWASNSCVDE
jgi:organic radical activating enzyme